MKTKVLALVTGSRTGVPYLEVARRLSLYVHDLIEAGVKEVTFMHGDAQGVDSFTKEFVNKTEATFRAHGIIVKQKPVPIKQHEWYIHDANCRHQEYPDNRCPAAGPRRNIKMVDLGPDVVLAFWDGKSRGTKQCMDYARSKNIEVREI